MGIGSGLGASFGISDEPAYGTFAAPTRHFRARSASVKKKKVTVQGGGMGAGAFAQPGELRTMTARSAEGGVELDVLTNKMGLLLKHIFGSAPTPAQQATSTAYLSAFALADNAGKSFTGQVGGPNVAGTAVPFTGTGGKITSAEFSCETNGNLKVVLEVDYQDETESQVLATPSLVAGALPFHFGQMAVKLGTFGSEAIVGGVKSMSMKIERPQAVERFYAKGAGVATKDEPIMNGFVAVSGSIDVDFIDKTVFHDRFATDTPTSLVWEFIGATIASTYKQTFRLKTPQVFFEDGYGAVEGEDVISASIPFTAQLDLTNGLVACDYISTDTTL